MGRDRKRRRRRREAEDGAPRERRRSTAPAPPAPRPPPVGEWIRYAIVCAVLLSVATPLGIAVAFFWGLSLLRRFQESGALGRLGGAPAGKWLPLPGGPPRLAPVPLAQILAGESAARAGRFAARGVELSREAGGEADGAVVQGDAQALGIAIGDLLDAALAELEEGEKPRLALELGENLAGSEVWLRLSGTGAVSAPGRPRGPAPLRLPGLGAADRTARACGGRLEVESTAGGGFELLLTLPKGPADRP
jgi:signal transduction histidine kinase